MFHPLHRAELTRLLAALLGSAEGGPLANWRQLSTVIADRMMEEMDGLAVMNNGMVGQGQRIGGQGIRGQGISNLKQSTGQPIEDLCSILVCHTPSQMSELDKECENGRLLRIVIKLGFVNERPELNGVSGSKSIPRSIPRYASKLWEALGLLSGNGAKCLGEG